MDNNFQLLAGLDYINKLKTLSASAKGKAAHWTKVHQKFEEHLQQVEAFRSFTKSLATPIIAMPSPTPIPIVPVPAATVPSPKVATPTQTPDVSEAESDSEEEQQKEKETDSIVSDQIVTKPPKYRSYPYSDNDYQIIKQHETDDSQKKVFNWYLKEKVNPAVLKKGQTRSYNHYNACIRATRQNYYAAPWRINENKGKFVLHLVEAETGKILSYELC